MEATIATAVATTLILIGIAILGLLPKRALGHVVEDPLQWLSWSFGCGLLTTLFVGYAIGLALPLGRVGPLLIGLIVLGAFAGVHRCRRILGDLTQEDRTRWIRPLAVLAVLVIAGNAMWWMWRGSETALFDGRANHDSYYYVTGADLVLEHRLWGTPDDVPATHAPTVWMFGTDSRSSRTGSYLFSALVSVLTGLEPVRSYILTGLVLLLGFGLGSYALSCEIWPLGSMGLWYRCGLVAAFVVAPPVVVVLFDGAYANLVGDVLLVYSLAFGWAWIRRGEWPLLILAAVGFNLLGVAYSELLLVGTGVLGVAWSIELARSLYEKNRQGLALRGCTLAAAAVAINPTVVPQVVRNIATIRTAIGGRMDFPPMLSNAHWIQWFGLPATIGTHGLGFLGVACGIAALVFLIFGMARAGSRPLVVGAVLVFLLAAFRVIGAGYAYGEYKTVLYFGQLLFVVTLAGGVVAFQSLRSRSPAAVAGPLALVMLNLVVWSGIATSLDSIFRLADVMKAVKSIDDSYFDLREVFAESRGAVLIADGLFRPEQQPFFRGQWYAYFAPGWTPVFGSPGEDGARHGGYLGNTLPEGNFGSVPSIDRVIAPRWMPGSTTLPIEGRELLVAGDVVVLDVSDSNDPIILPISGVWGQESGYRWISDEAWFEVRRPRPSEDPIDVNVAFCTRFVADEVDVVDVLGIDEPLSVELEDGVGEIDFRIPGGYRRFGLRSRAGAVSPISIGYSTDPRDLSYRVCTVDAR